MLLDEARLAGVERGERVYRGLPAGRVVVELTRADGRKEEREAEIRPGATAEVFFPDD